MAADQSPSFADLLRAARRAAGLTQEGLAERAGVSTRGISDLERGIIRAPRRDTLELLARALNLPAEERRAWERTRKRHYKRSAKPSVSNVPASDTHLTNLPIPLTTFVGREHETAQLVAMLRQSENRLVTFTGPAGVGKTRLAIAVGQELLDEMPDGAWFVDLAPLSDPELTLTTIAMTLRLSVARSKPVLVTLVEALRNKRLLLVLDNVEHLVAATPPLSDLLAACPRLSILVTSRVPLRLLGEQEYPVNPLELPDLAERADIIKIQQAPAVSLFIQRAQALKPDFTLTAENAPVIVEICQHLDGLPLAIELAAARIRVLSPQALVSRLDHRLNLLRSDLQRIPDRQRTLRDAIAWSYDLLSDDAQALFRRLAVFPAGADLQAAEAIAEDELGFDTLDGLEQLLEHSLIRVNEQPDGAVRYTMLETIREFGLEALEARGEAKAQRQRHLDYCLTLAEQAEPNLRGPDQAFWMERLDREHANLRAALRWAIDRGRGGDVAATLSGLRLAGALWWFWWLRGYMREGRDQLAGVVQLARNISVADQPIVEAENHASAYAKALFGLGTLSHWLAEYDRARELMTDSLEIYRRLRQPEDVASALIFLGYLAQHQGDFEAARARLNDGIELLRELDDSGGVALGLLGLGEMALRMGNYDEGATHLLESIARFASLEDQRGVAAARATLGAIRLRQGNVPEAGELLWQSIEVRYELGDKGGIAWCLERAAELVLARACTTDEAMRAVRLLSVARETRTEISAEIDPVDRPSYERLVAAGRAQLSELAFMAAWEAGRSLGLEQAVSEAEQGIRFS